MRRLAMVTLFLCSAVGCAGRSGAGNQGQLPSAQLLDELVDASASYRRLGRLTATGSLPFIGTVAFAAGSGDSTIGIISLSLENRAFAFQREGTTFLARYRVSLSVAPRGGRSIDLSREEIVRVASFTETQRADESVLFQQALRLAPGLYRVVVNVRDMSSTAEGRAEQEVTAPAFSAGGTTAPILTYQATGRGTAQDPVSVVVNPRGTIAYGADTLLAYVEGYQFPGPTTVPFEVRDDQQRVFFRDSLHFRGGRPVESQVIRIAPDSITLGELKLVVGQGSQERSAIALVSFSQAWVATNFEEVIDILRYFGHENQIRALRRAPPGERARRWREFYRETDPDPLTPENEALSAYFRRVVAANKLFADEAILGWQTDRGEVYITLGPPDEITETGPGQNRIVRWSYFTHRLTLFFQDENGFGRLRLTSDSRSEYERIRNRIRRQAP